MCIAFTRIRYAAVAVSAFLMTAAWVAEPVLAAASEHCKDVYVIAKMSM